MKYQTALEIEIAVSRYLNYRENLIVPNISWGLNIHECDLLVVTKAGYLYEVEIKVSKRDLIKDKLKSHGHQDGRIRKLFFAIPWKLRDYVEHIPERAGIITIDTFGRCYREREAKINYIAKKILDEDKMQIARLGAMRIWGLKRKVFKLKEVIRNENNK